MDIQKEREEFEAWHYEQYLIENPNIDITNAKYIYDYAHNNALVYQLRESHFTAWQAAKAQSEKALLEQFEINNKLVEQIEKLKAQAVPQWISVEDQMPDGYLPVLVVNQKGKIRICEWAFYEQEWWKSPCLKPVKSTITHWMPLPEPPTKECK